MSSRASGIVSLAVLLVALVPARALACPVCGLAGPGDNGWAYLAMTLVMSALPLGFISGVVYWVYRRMSAVAAADPSRVADSPSGASDALMPRDALR
jgi:hypothetical protein